MKFVLFMSFAMSKSNLKTMKLFRRAEIFHESVGAFRHTEHHLRECLHIVTQQIVNPLAGIGITLHHMRQISLASKRGQECPKELVHLSSACYGAQAAVSTSFGALPAVPNRKSGDCARC